MGNLTTLQKYLLIRTLNHMNYGNIKNRSHDSVNIVDVNFREINKCVYWDITINGLPVEIKVVYSTVTVSPEDQTPFVFILDYRTEHKRKANAIQYLPTGNCLYFNHYPTWDKLVENIDTEITHFGFKHEKRNEYRVDVTSVNLKTIKCLDDGTWARSQGMVLSLFTPFLTARSLYDYQFSAEDIFSISNGTDRELIIFTSQGVPYSAILTQERNGGVNVQVSKDSDETLMEFTVDLDEEICFAHIQGKRDNHIFDYELDYSDEHMLIKGSLLEEVFYYYQGVDSFAALMSNI